MLTQEAIDGFQHYKLLGLMTRRYVIWQMLLTQMQGERESVSVQVLAQSCSCR